jgi:sulfotransferase
MKTIHFISGLPRSGTTLLANILKQNPKIHSEAVSSLSSIFGSINVNWNNIEASQEYPNYQAKIGVLKSILQGYYSHIDKPIVFDKDRSWIYLIPVVEEILQKQVKIIVCVRNPAEIVTSFEKLRRENPLFVTRADHELRDSNSIASRAFYYSGPEGPLGKAHQGLKDAITMGYLDRFIFVDYNLFCGSPKAQTKRIYDFFELPSFEHDFKKIEQVEQYNDLAVGLPNLHKIKPELNKTTINCVKYIGLDLYEQYNREIFWNAWI